MKYIKNNENEIISALYNVLMDLLPSSLDQYENHLQISIESLTETKKKFTNDQILENLKKLLGKLKIFKKITNFVNFSETVSD